MYTSNPSEQQCCPNVENEASKFLLIYLSPRMTQLVMHTDEVNSKKFLNLLYSFLTMGIKFL